MKLNILEFLELKIKPDYFFSKYVKSYHMLLFSGHGPVIINIRQPFTSAASNSAPIAHFGRPGDSPRYNWHNRTDSAELGPMPTQFWFTMAKLYREVAKMNPDFVVIRPKSARWSPLCPLRHCLYPEHLQNWAFWAELKTVNLKCCSLFSGTEPWPIH